MKGRDNPTWDYFRLLLFVVFLTEVLLFFLALIFGRLLGYDTTFRICFWLGVITAACFACVVLFNLCMIGIARLYFRIKR
jgi:hypothetical protein